MTCSYSKAFAFNYSWCCAATDSGRHVHRTQHMHGALHQGLLWGMQRQRPNSPSSSWVLHPPFEYSEARYITYYI